MAAPLPRLPALDALRGSAVLGILLMNIVSFAMPAAAYLNPRAYGTHDAADIAAWGLCFVLVDGKMRALFSLLFGASMLLVIERAEAVGADGAAVHLRRMAALFAIGLAHAYLVWSGDILVLYAGAGTLALAAAGWSTRRLVAAGVLLLATQMLLTAVLLAVIDAMRDAALAPDASAATRRAWRDAADQVGVPSASALGRDLALHRGGYAALVADRLHDWSAPFLQYLDAGLETVGLMLLGMAGHRSGFLTGAWRRASYARVAAGCYVAAVPALVLIARATSRCGFDEVATLAAAALAAAPFRPILTIGHAALLLCWLTGGGAAAAKARLAAVGQAALSNYVGTSIVMTGLFYGYGGGLYGRLDRAELFLVVPFAWAAMLAWSQPWLHRYCYGPLEWLWRSLAQGRSQPMRRRT